MQYERDPVSLIFDPLSRQALARCYASPGRRVPVRLPRITPRVYIAWLGRNTDLRQRDPWRPELDRWARSFIRSAYWQHRWHGGFGGLREQENNAPFDGLSLIYGAENQAAGWLIRLIAAPEGFTVPGHRRTRFTDPGKMKHRPGGVGAGTEL